MEYPEFSIARMYTMLYPYGEYSGDIPVTCLAIHKKLKELCREGRKDTLLVIGKYLGLVFEPDDSIRKICEEINNILIDRCLSVDSNVSAKFIIGYVTGVIDPTNVEVEDMETIRYVLGGNTLADGLNYIIYDGGNKRSSIETLMRSIDDIRQIYGEELDDNFPSPAGVSDMFHSMVKRHTDLIYKVLSLIRDGKLPYDVTYSQIIDYLKTH